MARRREAIFKSSSNAMIKHFSTKLTSPWTQHKFVIKHSCMQINPSSKSIFNSFIANFHVTHTMLKNHSKSLIRIEVNSVVCDTNVSCLFTYDTNFSCLFTFDKIFSCLFTCDVQLFVYIWYEFQLLVYINRTDISCLLTFIIHMSAVCLWLAIESWCKSPNETILVYFQTLWYLLVFKAHDRKASSEQNWILSSCKKSLFKLTIFGSL